jgi:hypothetical protein
VTFKRFALALHLPVRSLEIKLSNLFYLIHRQRREDHNLVDAIAELRAKSAARRPSKLRS